MSMRYHRLAAVDRLICVIQCVVCWQCCLSFVLVILLVLFFFSPNICYVSVVHWRPDMIFVCLTVSFSSVFYVFQFLLFEVEQVCIFFFSFFFILHLSTMCVDGCKKQNNQRNVVCLFDSFLFSHYSRFKFCLCRFGHI